MIPIKKPNEIAIMEKAGKILAEVLEEVLRHAKPGVKEIELDRLAEELTLKKGGEPGFKKVPGYHHSICVATNDVVVHGIPGNYSLKEGDIIGIDYGVYLDGFHTDMAETIRIGGKEPGVKGEEDETDKFLRIGKEALYEGIAQVKPGNHIGHISKAIQEKVEKEGGYSVTRSLIGHGVGKDLHEEPEVPGYLEGEINETPLLVPGMTIAVEVIYIMGKPEVMYSGTDDWTIKSADGTLGGLFERTVLVTDTGHRILTQK